MSSRFVACAVDPGSQSPRLCLLPTETPLLRDATTGGKAIVGHGGCVSHKAGGFCSAWHTQVTPAEDVKTGKEPRQGPEWSQEEGSAPLTLPALGGLVGKVRQPHLARESPQGLLSLPGQSSRARSSEGRDADRPGHPSLFLPGERSCISGISRTKLPWYFKAPTLDMSAKLGEQTPGRRGGGECQTCLCV